jgi:hypothetical protein
MFLATPGATVVQISSRLGVVALGVLVALDDLGFGHLLEATLTLDALLIFDWCTAIAVDHAKKGDAILVGWPDTSSPEPARATGGDYRTRGEWEP